MAQKQRLEVRPFNRQFHIPCFSCLLLHNKPPLNFSSVQFSRSVVSDSLWPHESQHARPPCLSPTPGVHSNSRPSSQWCHLAISSSVIPFSSCPQSLPASESSPMSQLFTWGGQSTGVSALASFLPKNTQGWSPLEWTGWISLQSKGLARVFSKLRGLKKEQSFYYDLLWMWERLKAGGERDNRGWDGWMASLTQWTRVWVNSGSWWWTGRPGMLQSMGSQRVGHGWVTEVNWIEGLLVTLLI